MMKRFHIRAVLFREEGWWVAQCLEHDIAVQATTQPDLIYELERILVGHLAVSEEARREPFASLPKAPRRYWEMYERAKPVEIGVLPFRQETPSPLPDIDLQARAA